MCAILRTQCSQENIYSIFFFKEKSSWCLGREAHFPPKSLWAFSCTCASISSTLGEVFEPQCAGADVLVAHRARNLRIGPYCLSQNQFHCSSSQHYEPLTSFQRAPQIHTVDKACIVSLLYRTAAMHLLTVPTFYSRCSQDETCQVYPLSGHYGRFQFNAFKFLRHLSSVYLKCKLLICDANDETSRCSQGCISRQKRDISSYKWKTDSVIGPIRLRRDRRAGGNSGRNTLFMISGRLVAREMWLNSVAPEMYSLEI